MRQRLLSRLQHAAAQAAAHSYGHKTSASIAPIGEVWLERAGRRQQLGLLSEQSFRPDAAISAKAALTTTAAATEGVVFCAARHSGSAGNGSAKPLKAAGTVTSPTHVQVLFDDKDGAGVTTTAALGHGRFVHTSASAAGSRASEASSGSASPAPAPAPASSQNIPTMPPQFDTLSIMRALQAQGIEDHRAEAITRIFQGLLEAFNNKAEQCYVRKEDFDKYELGHAASISVFKNEMKNTQHNQNMQVARELETLRTEVNKLRSDLQHEVEKITASHRLDINLEKGRIRDMLHQQEEKQLIAERRVEDAQTQFEKRLDNEVSSLRTQMEVNKNDLIKYSVASIVTLITLVVGVARLVM